MSEPATHLEPHLDPPLGVDDWADPLAAALDGRGIRSVYQPIIDLHRCTIVGYEALTRFDLPVGGLPRGPEAWFRAAHGLGFGPRLEAVALRRALASRLDLPRNCFLAVNVDPESVCDPAVQNIFRSQGHLGGLVVEITEHRRWNWADLAPAVRRLRSAGALLAVDDAGAGYSGLQQILQLRPSILKLDRALVSGIDDDEAKRALVQMLGLFANRINAWILAEGAETPGEARTLVELEVPLAQGYYFARPAEPWAELPAPMVAELGKSNAGAADTLHHLVHPVASIDDTQDIGAGWRHHSDPWVVVVDRHRRPLGLVDRDAARSGTLLGALVANVHSSPQELAQRLATSHAPVSAPVIVTDNAGRYLGLVTIRCLLRTLSDLPGD